MSATSTSTDPVTAIVDILQGVADTQWHNDTPPDTIEDRTETTPKGRENNPNPALYVWRPVETSISREDAEGSMYTEPHTVEIAVWAMQDNRTFNYHRDVIHILEQYDRDNESNTEFHKIQPSSISDRRTEKIVRTTDHYIIGVQAEAERVRD